MNSAKEGLEKMMMIDNDYQIFYELQQDLDNGKAQYNKGFSVLYYYHCGHVNKLTPTNLQPYETMVENCTTDIGKYWSLYGLCFLVYDHIEGYMHHFESFLNIARKIDSTNPTFNVHLISALQMIATKHVHLGFFEKANQFYEEIFEILKKQEVKNVSPSVYINYIMNLVKLNRYKDAIIQISYVEKNIQLNQQDKTQLTIRKIMCYTFLEDAENLINAIYSIEYANLVATHRIYFRLSLCNAYLIQQNFLLAETEINNLLRSKLMKEVDADFLPCAELMNYLIVQIRKNNKLAISNEQTEIFNTLQITLKVNQYPYLKNYTPYLWLTEKLGL
jgi:tetratricopeptide (TPR) repeat protein